MKALIYHGPGKKGWEEKPKPVIHLTRRFVGPVNEDLHEMEDEQHVHRLRGEVVNPAQQPAAGHFVLDIIDAFPGRLRTGAVSHPEKNPGNKLDGERESERAAPNIAPARAAWHIFIEGFVKEFFVAGPVVQPGKQRVHAGVFFACPAWKF